MTTETMTEPMATLEYNHDRGTMEAVVGDGRTLVVDEAVYEDTLAFAEEQHIDEADVRSAWFWDRALDNPGVRVEVQAAARSGRRNALPARASAPGWLPGR